MSEKSQTKPSGIYKLPNTDWFNDDLSVLLEDILESGAIEEIGLPQEIIDRYEESNDAEEVGEWIDKHAVQLLEPIE